MISDGSSWDECKAYLGIEVGFDCGAYLEAVRAVGAGSGIGYLGPNAPAQVVLEFDVFRWANVDAGPATYAHSPYLRHLERLPVFHFKHELGGFLVFREEDTMVLKILGRVFEARLAP